MAAIVIKRAKNTACQQSGEHQHAICVSLEVKARVLKNSGVGFGGWVIEDLPDSNEAAGAARVCTRNG